MKEESIIKAGQIAKQVKEYAKTIVKKDVSLLEIAEKIETKIQELGGEPAFPTNLSIDSIAAHFTPAYNDETLARGLIKVDLGVHIDGWIADTAFSLDLENNEENKKLIEAAEKSLTVAQEKIKLGISTSEIGKSIQETTETLGFTPIINLSGHQINQYDLHAGVTIPNFEDKSNSKIEKGLYAIEPFVTLKTGTGRIYDGKPSGIYSLSTGRIPRSPLAREVLDYILDKYQTLPFCSRWLVKKFGTRAILALKQLEDNGNIHQYSQLIEASNSKVSQAENTILITKEKKIITTF